MLAPGKRYLRSVRSGDVHSRHGRFLQEKVLRDGMFPSFLGLAVVAPVEVVAADPMVRQAQFLHGGVSIHLERQEPQPERLPVVEGQSVKAARGVV